MAACRTLLNDPTLMYFVMWALEVLISTWVIQYTWNFVVAGKDNSKGKLDTDAGVRDITFWEAFLVSLTIKLIIFGFSGFMMNA